MLPIHPLQGQNDICNISTCGKIIISWVTYNDFQFFLLTMQLFFISVNYISGNMIHLFYIRIQEKDWSIKVARLKVFDEDLRGDILHIWELFGSEY